MTKMNKTFDCVQMKREASLRIHELLKGKSVKEQIEYWKKRNEITRLEQEKIMSSQEETIVNKSS